MIMGVCEITSSSRSADENPIFICWKKPTAASDNLFAPVPVDRFGAGQLVPVERWIFGQQNRVLPAKVNSRLLIHLMEERKAEVDLFEAASTISNKAVTAFTFLNKLDRRFGNGKDDQLTTGFPEPGSDKAQSRYANHFVAYESKEGNLTGMLLQWKFAGVRRAKNRTFLLPTQACLEFACLPNPILDQPVEHKPTTRFSAEEIAWLLDHISCHVPVEASTFRTILEGLQARCITPDALDAYVCEHAKEKPNITEALLSTQRSGAVSRMADLGLVRRQREGTKVCYEMTDLGSGWLEKLRTTSSE